MKNFVELIQAVIDERYLTVMNKIAAEKIPAAFFSLNPGFAIEQVKGFRRQGLNIVTLIIPDTPREDSDTDFEIVGLGEFAKRHLKPEYVFATGIDDTRIAIKNFSGCKILNLFAPQYSEQYYNEFINHLPELYEVYESLIDEESKKTFCGYWHGRTSSQFDKLVHAIGCHYFTAGFTPKPGDVVIDAGVLDGATSLEFHELGCKVYGFEMDRENFKVAKKLADEKGFVVENFGLGAYEHQMTYTHAPFGNPGGSNLNEGGNEVTNIIPLDLYVRQKNIHRVDFIKFDVEGAELDVLKGAATTIARCKPILNISAYHKPDDFRVLMNMVKKIRPDYEFALRHYASSRLDEPFRRTPEFDKQMTDLGLEPIVKGYEECCLLAR